MPLYLQKPLAIFKGNHDNSFAVLTEIVINGNPALCTIEIGKGGADIEFNLITSVYDKDKNKLANWINNERLLYVGNKKALRDLCNSAPIAETASDEALISAAKVIQNFENPPINSEKNSGNLQGGEDVRFSVAGTEKDVQLSSEDREILKGYNDKFNEDLQKQIEGTLPSDYVYSLGRPLSILRATGIPDLPIELKPLNKKKSQKRKVIHLICVTCSVLLILCKILTLY